MHSHHGFASCAENVPCGLIKSTKPEKSAHYEKILFSFSLFLNKYCFGDDTTSVQQRASVLSATAGSGDAWTGGASAARVSERA